MSILNQLASLMFCLSASKSMKMAVEKLVDVFELVMNSKSVAVSNIQFLV